MRCWLLLLFFRFPFSYDCDYCGETHEGFFGVFITMIHTVLAAVKLITKAVQK